LFTLLLIGCEDQVLLVENEIASDSNDDPPDDGDNSDITDRPKIRVLREGAKVYIVDRTDKKWDVTHADTAYGFKPEEFQFGLGPDAIKPISDAEMICEGFPGYPVFDDPRLVMGVKLSGEVRAYPIDIMSRHEVANEQFGEAFVSVAY